MAGLDSREIASQQDHLSRPWQYNGNQWVLPMMADLTTDHRDNPNITTFSADFDTRRELDYKASGTAVDIALRRLPPPRDPYEQQASAQDAPSLQPANWIRNAEKGHWQRDVVIAVAERGIHQTRLDIASPERAAQLDQQAADVIRLNVAHGPLPVVARYDAAWHLNGWNTQWPRSQAAETAMDASTLRASNGTQYRLGDDGHWRNGNEIATGNIATELSATRSVMLPMIEQHNQVMAALPAWQRPTQEQIDMTTLSGLYAAKGEHLTPQELAATYAAVVETREQYGLSITNTSLDLDPSVTGPHMGPTPVRHLQQQPGDIIRVAATTWSEDIERSRLQMKALESAPGLLKQTQSEPTQPAQNKSVPAPSPEVQSSIAVPAGFAPALRIKHDLRDLEQPGHAAYVSALDAVQRMEARQNIAPGEHTQILAARLAAESAERKQGITHVEMGRDGQIHVIERHSAFDEGRRFSVSAGEAMSQNIAQSSSRWLDARSPHYQADQPAAARSAMQSQALAELNPADQMMFSAIRGRTPAHIGDDTVVHAMTEAKRNGIHDASRIETVAMHGNGLHVIGNIPGVRASVDVTATAPPLAQSMAVNESQNQERQQALAMQAQQQQTQSQGQSPTLHR